MIQQPKETGMHLEIEPRLRPLFIQDLQKALVDIHYWDGDNRRVERLGHAYGYNHAYDGMKKATCLVSFGSRKYNHCGLFLGITHEVGWNSEEDELYYETTYIPLKGVYEVFVCEYEEGFLDNPDYDFSRRPPAYARWLRNKGWMLCRHNLHS